MSVVVGKYGRIILPKELREKYGVTEGCRLIIRERGGEIVLIPVRRYGKPTEALYGSVKVEKPIEDPKKFAREQVKRKLVGEIS